MIIEAIFFVAGAVPGVAWAVIERRHMKFWRREAKETLDMAGEAVAQRDKAEADQEKMRAKAVAMAGQNADLRAKLEALQPKVCALPKRDAAGRFVAREVQA